MSVQWTEADFDALSWHDNHVHGLELLDRGLALHLGYILEWLPPVDGRYTFAIAPAVLRFRQVSALRIDLDFVGPQAMVTPFSLSGIGREEVRYENGQVSWRWTIGVNWPEGSITFESPGFEQKLVGAYGLTGERAPGGNGREAGVAPRVALRNHSLKTPLLRSTPPEHQVVAVSYTRHPGWQQQTSLADVCD